MKKYSRLVTLLWISLLVLTLFPLAVQPAQAETFFTFEGEWGGLIDPEFVGADDTGFYVADDGNIRVQGFHDGSSTPSWTTYFSSVGGIYVDWSGHVWITEPYALILHDLFGDTGEVTKDITTPIAFGAIAIGHNFSRYVSDFDNPTFVQKYYGHTTLSLEWTFVADYPVVGIAAGTAFFGIGGEVYVADDFNVYVLSETTGEEFMSWTPGFQIGGIAVDYDEDVYLTDVNAHTVSKFTYYGAFLASWGGYGSDPGQFINPTGVAVDSYESVYVADTGNDRVQKFSQVEVLPPAPEGSYTYGGPAAEFGTNVVETSDGGFALAGSTYSFGAGNSDFWLVRTDSDGVMLWSQTYGSSDHEYALSVVETADGGFAIVGSTYNSSDAPFGENSSILLVKVDSLGVELWNRTYGDPSSYQYGNSIVECGDGGFAIAGSNRSSISDDPDAWLIRTDSNGVEIWNQTYGGAGFDYLRSVVETADGGFALAGYTDSFGAGEFDLWLVKTDSAGVMLWDHTYGGPFNDNGFSLVECDDGGFALAGAANNTGFLGAVAPTDAWLFRTDSSGNELWNKTYGGSLDDRAFSIVETVDGGFAFAGNTRSFGAGDFDVWFVEVDSDGVMLRSQTYGGLRADSAMSLVQTVDGGFALAGTTRSFGAGVQDFFLVIIEPELEEIGAIYVNNVVVGDPPDEPWNYLILDSEDNVVADFELPAEGGSADFTDPPFAAGGVFRIIATPKFGYATDISVQTDAGSSSEIDGLEVTIDLASTGEAIVTFTNTPESGIGGLDEIVPNGWFYNIPEQKPIPIQSACPVDINNDGELDLVLGKPMAILVNLTGLPAADGEISVSFDGGAPYTRQVTAANIIDQNIIGFYPIVPNTAGTGKEITGSYTLGANVGALDPTPVSVKETHDLKLYFVYMHNPAYGNVSEATFYENAAYISEFLNATYPVKNVTVYATYDESTKVIGTSGPFSSVEAGEDAVRDDCDLVRNVARDTLGPSKYTIGIGIAPNNTLDGKPDYFTHKGTASDNLGGAVGYSRGPGTKGVIVLEGYYGAGAHEVAHTFKIYYGIPEQYQGFPYNETGGMPCNGVWAQQGQWRTGISFMGLIEEGTCDDTWVDNVYTYYNLFRNFTVNGNDPEILQVEGIIHKDGTVELTSNWYHMAGTPDPDDPGAYSLKFLDEENNVLKDTSFDAKFFENLDPGISLGQDIIVDPKFGTKETDTAPFAFSTEYPEGTAEVQIVDNTDPQNPVVMSTIDAEDIINYPVTKGYFTDSDFNPINSFDCLFTPSFRDYYRMTATNPDTFYYHLQIRSTDPTGLFTITVQIPSDFDLKPLSRRDSPVQIDGEPVAFSFSSDGVLTVSNVMIEENELITLSVHLEYELKCSRQRFPPSAPTTYFETYDFTATLNSVEAPTATITAVGKEVTAIGGLIRDLLGKPKGGLTITVTTKSGSIVGTCTSSSDGFYLIEVPPGTYTVKVYDSFGTRLAQAKNVKVAQNRFVKKNFWLLLSILDSAVMGFVKDDVGNGVSGVTVELLRSDTVMATTTTNLGGYYMFRFFLPGEYTVRITVPEGYTATTTSETVWISLAETATVNFKLTHILP